MSTQELRDRLESIIADRQGVLSKADAEGRDLVDDERAELDRLATEFKSLNADLDRRTAVEADAGDLEIPSMRKTTPTGPNDAGGETDSGLSLVDGAGHRVRMLGPNDKLTRRGDVDPKFSLARAVCAMRTGDWDAAPHERQAMMAQVVGTDSDGGYLVPKPISNEIIDLVREKSRLTAAGVRTIPMTSNTLDIAIVEEGPTPNWRAELGKINTTEATFGNLTLTARALGSIVVASEELLQDAPNADILLRRLLADALAEELDRVGLLGTGVAPQPRGILNWPGIEAITTAGEFDYGDIIDALEALWANGADPDTVILSPRERAAMARLADTTGQPLVAPKAVQDLSFLTSRKIPVNGGTGTNESTAFVGGFDQCVFGMRERLHISIANTGPINETGDDAFEHYAVRIRAVLRADFAVLRPDHVAVISGITPPA